MVHAQTQQTSAATLEAMRQEPSCLWLKAEEGVERIGFGVACWREAHTEEHAWKLVDSLAQTALLHEGPVAPPGPWFGGWAFDVTRPPEEEWLGFPISGWFVPRRLLWRTGETWWETAFDVSTPSRGVAPNATGCDTLGRGQDYRALARRAVRAVADGVLSKVVVARAVDATLSCSATELARRLAFRQPYAQTYLLRAGAATFLGCSPERFLIANGRSAEVDALAGTAPIGGNFGEKELREQSWVVKGVTESVSDLAERVEPQGRPREVRAGRSVHLRSVVSLRLREGATLGALARALHPTPALGGTPRSSALAFIAEHEGLERGWYGGAIGWLGPNRAELSVAIRCALVRGSRCRCFVGAGIVRGSDPKSEWRETELKARTLLDAVEGSHAA